MSASLEAPIQSAEEENEPGACYESMLVTTDMIEEFSQAMSSSLSLEETKQLVAAKNIEEITGENENKINDGASSSNSEDPKSDMKKSESFSSETGKSKDLSVYEECNDEPNDDYFMNEEWLKKKLHVFILSAAGKPIYSLHGSEDKIVTTFGIMQALVSFVQSTHDSIKSIHANGVKFVFLVRHPMILVAVSRTNISVQQTQMLLT